MSPNPEDELKNFMNPHNSGNEPKNNLNYEESSEKFDQSSYELYKKTLNDSKRNDKQKIKELKKQERFERKKKRQEQHKFQQQNSSFNQFIDEMNYNKQKVIHSNEPFLTKIWLIFLITLKIILYPFAKVLEPFAKLFGRSYEFLLSKVIPFLIIVILVIFLAFRGTLYIANYSQNHGMSLREGIADNFNNLWTSISKSFSNAFEKIARFALNDFYDEFFPEPEVKIEDEGLDVGLVVDMMGLNNVNYYNHTPLSFYGDIKLTVNSNNPTNVSSSCYIDKISTEEPILCKINGEDNLIKYFYSQISEPIKIETGIINKIGTHKLNIVNSFEYNSSTTFSISFVDEDYMRVLANQNKLSEFSETISKTASNPIVLGFNFPNKPIVIREGENNLYYFHFMLENNWDGKLSDVSKLHLKVPSWVEEVDCGLLKNDDESKPSEYDFLPNNPNWFKAGIENELGVASFFCSYDINVDEFYKANQNQQEAKGTFSISATYDYKYENSFSFVVKDVNAVSN